MWEYDLVISDYIDELKARKKKSDEEEAAAKSSKSKSKFKQQKLPKYRK